MKTFKILAIVGAATISASLFAQSAHEYFQQSQKYSMDHKPKMALNSINHALQIRPNDIEYLKSKAIIGSWLSDKEAMHQAYTKILVIHPNDEFGLLSQARYTSRFVSMNDGAKLYADFIKLFPNNKEALIEYIRLEGSKGHFSNTEKLLETYKNKFGETREYKATKARVLAQARCSKESLKLINPLLAKQPKNQDYLYTKALALDTGYDYEGSLKTIDTMHTIDPYNVDAKNLHKFVNTKLRSDVYLGANHYFDTDKIRITTGKLGTNIFLSPLTKLMFSTQHEHLSAKRNSAYTTTSNEKTINISDLWGGISHQFSPYFAGTAMGGYAHIDTVVHNDFLYYLNADIKPRDHVDLSLIHSYLIYDRSPRSVSRNVRQRLNKGILSFQPTHMTYVTATAEYGAFSDKNSQYTGTLSPSIGVVRNGWMNLNLGLYGEWNHFSKQLTNNGYYDPNYYRRYQVTANAYFIHSDNVGLALSGAAGIQKDETFSNYRFAGDLALKLTIGIFRDWQLELSSAYSNRFLDKDTYHAYSLGAVITRRF